ncbi:MAG: chromosomal replication initiator protein DnaA [Azospirillaceae bacterium]
MPERQGTINPRTDPGTDPGVSSGISPGTTPRGAPTDQGLADQGLVDQVWVRVRARLRDEVGEAAFKSWLKPLTLSGIGDGAVRISVPTKFMRDWVSSHYAERIRCLFNDEIGGIDSIDVDIASRLGSESAPAGDAVVTAPPRAEADGVDPRPARIEDFGAALDPRYTFDHFVVGKPNELAHAASRRVAEASKVTFNPLFLYGGVGLGKTHLMHAIAAEIRRNHPERRVLYLSAEKFMYHFIRALRFKDTVSFKEMFRSVDVLMIDDVQFISGKESTQEEFFHTFNALVDQNRQVIISADKSPGDLEGMEERLKSRLGWGLVADIHPTTYELRLGILQARADLYRHVDIPNKVLEYLAHKITSNVRELEGAFNRLIANAELVGRAITLESTNELLHDILRIYDRKLTIHDNQRKVAEHYNIRVADMHSARRARSVARPRQVAMYLAKQLTARSLPEIGRKFGGRDHTTVMHAVKKVEELSAGDAAFAEDVDLLRRMLGG